MSDHQIVKLFSIKVTHDFYADGVCQDFCFHPSIESVALLKRYKMFLREVPNGIEVFYEADNSGTAIKKITIEEKFVFYLKLKNKLFYNFSDIPDQNIHSNVFYFTNKQTSDTDSLNLFSSGSSVSENDYVAIKSQRFTVEADSDTSKVKFKLIDLNEEIIKQSNAIIELKDKASSSDPDEYQIIYQVDLQNRKAGKYVFKIDDEENLTFYSDDILFSEKYFGVVEIYKSDNTAKAYSIAFTQKSSYWKYIIVPKYQTDITISNLQIDSSESFEDVVTSTLNDGTSVGIIESTDEIEFSDKALTSIKLQLKGSGNQVTTLLENLANPDPANVKIEKNTNKVYSEVFVYI